jgi:hypothetical protein
MPAHAGIQYAAAEVMNSVRICLAEADFEPTCKIAVSPRGLRRW